MRWPGPMLGRSGPIDALGAAATPGGRGTSPQARAERPVAKNSEHGNKGSDP